MRLLRLLLVCCISLVSTSELPRIPGYVTTLTRTSDQTYKPFTLRRSRFISDGSNAFLLVDSSALVKLSAPEGEVYNYIVTQLAGHPVIAGYKDGNVSTSRFNNIADFAQNEDGSKVYIADQNNHCIRLFDRNANNVTVYAGNCTHYGGYTGARLAARFSNPSGIVMSNTWTELYVADRQNNRILRIDLVSPENWVETVIDTSYPEQSRVILPTSIAMSSRGDKLYVTTEYGLVSLAGFNSNESFPVRHNYNTRIKKTNMLSLALVDGDRYAVVTELYENRVLLVDLLNGGTGQICTGQLTRPLERVDGSSDVCEFNSPHGVAVINGSSLFVTEHGSRMIRRVTFQLPAGGITTVKPTTTTRLSIPTSSVATRTHRKTTQRRRRLYSTSQWFYPSFMEETTTTRAEDVSPLVLGLSAGIVIPLVLIGALISLISYIRLQGTRDARRMYVRRTEQGGYDGPQLDERRFQPATTSVNRAPLEQPPSYTARQPYIIPHSYDV